MPTPMEWAFYFQPTRGFVYVRVWGIAAVAGFRTVRAAMVADERFDPTLSLILDLSALDVSQLTSQDIANLASNTEFDQKARRALVVSRADQFGIGRMYQTYRALHGGTESINVVYSVREAMNWLGLTDASMPMGDARSESDGRDT
jgi:hypothetical protein